MVLQINWASLEQSCVMVSLPESTLILNNGNKCYIKAIGGLEGPKFQLVYFERSRYARDMKFHL